MESTISNPYQTPAAEVMEANDSGLTGILPRFSAWGVFGLTVVTLGLYMYYWMYARSRAVNQHVANPINQPFMGITVALMVCSWASNFVAQVAPGPGAIMGLAGLAGTVMFVIWLYQLRSRLHQIQGLSKGHPLWIGPVLTFFATVIYLQYKINQSLDRQAK